MSLLALMHEFLAPLLAPHLQHAPRHCFDDLMKLLVRMERVAVDAGHQPPQELLGVRLFNTLDGRLRNLDQLQYLNDLPPFLLLLHLLYLTQIFLQSLSSHHNSILNRLQSCLT